MTVDQITIRNETTFHDGDPTPPPPVDHHVAPPPKVSTDRTVDSIGLVGHPTPKVIAGDLRELAKLLDTDGATAVKAAAFLAARGWPTATLGDGTGSRTTTSLTSTERAVIGKIPDDDKPHDLDPGHWDDIDRKLAKLLRLTWKTCLDVQTAVADLVAHADDIDELPAGHGECMCCGRFCVPAKDSNDRLRSGLCDACRKAWDRAGRPERTDWMHARRHRMFDGRKGACDRCKRPWTAVDEAVSA